MKWNSPHPDPATGSDFCRFLDAPCRGDACLFWSAETGGGPACVTRRCLSGLAALGASPWSPETPAEAFAATGRLLLCAPPEWSEAALGHMPGGPAKSALSAAYRSSPALDARTGRDPRRSLHRLARLVDRIGPQAVLPFGSPRRMTAYAFWELWDFQFLDRKAAAVFLDACGQEELNALASVLDDANYAVLLAAAGPDTARLMEAARIAAQGFLPGVLALAGDALERAALLGEDGRLSLPLPGFSAAFSSLEPLPESVVPPGLKACSAGCCPILDAVCVREGCALWENAGATCGVIAWSRVLFETGGPECPATVREALAASLGRGGDQVFRMLALPVQAAIWSDFALESLSEGVGLEDAPHRQEIASALLTGMGRADRLRLQTAAVRARPELAGLPLAVLTASVDVLAGLSDEDFRELLKEVTYEELGQSLADAGDALREKCRRNLSERTFAMLREDVNRMGRVRLGDARGAQRQVLRTAYRLAREGRVRLPDTFAI